MTVVEDVKHSNKTRLEENKERLNLALQKLEDVLIELSSNNKIDSKSKNQIEQLQNENLELKEELNIINKKYGTAKIVVDQVLGDLDESINLIQTTLGKNEHC